MESCTIQAHAKINLGLDVLRRREDGYHELRMIMQDLELCDELTIRRWEDSEADRSRSAVCEGVGERTEEDRPLLSGERIFGQVTGAQSQPGLQMDKKNLAYRAALLLMEEFRLPGYVEILLEKRIPMAAGLAGGSADAAAVLRGMNELFRLGLTMQELMRRGLTLGADIPYCIMGGTALAEGIGEKLTLLPVPPACRVLLVKPPEGVSTAFVYGNLHLEQVLAHPDIDRQIRALHRGNLEELAGCMGNLLEDVTVQAVPRVDEIRKELLKQGAAGARMSGSGPTVFGLFHDVDVASEAEEAMKKRFSDCQVILTGFRRQALN